MWNPYNQNPMYQNPPPTPGMAYPGAYPDPMNPGFHPQPSQPPPYYGGEMQPPYNVQGQYNPPPPISGYQTPYHSTGWQPGVGYASSNASHLYSNIPPPSQLHPITGKRKALLIGINYLNSDKNRLKGCINDVRNWGMTLERVFNFNPYMMHSLSDDRDPFWQPTRANILREIQWLVSDAQPGDSLFFLFSGHGGQKADQDGDEADGYDETILPVDYQKAGVIIDDELHDRLVKPLPSGCRLTAVMDCCHSGTGLDLPFIHTEPEEQSKYHTMFRLNRPPSAQVPENASKVSNADVILFSGCQDNQISADSSHGGEPQGAMSFAMLKVLQTNPHVTYAQLLQEMRQALKKSVTRFTQTPQLSTGRPFDVNQMFQL